MVVTVGIVAPPQQSGGLFCHPRWVVVQSLHVFCMRRCQQLSLRGYMDEAAGPYPAVSSHIPLCPFHVHCSREQDVANQCYLGRKILHQQLLLSRKHKEQVNPAIMDNSNTTESERYSSSFVYTNRTELALHESVFSSFIIPRLMNKWTEFAFTRRFY